jgi:hypothetical protein
VRLVEVGDHLLDSGSHVLEPRMELHPHDRVPGLQRRVLNAENFPDLDMLEELVHLGEPPVESQDHHVRNCGDVEYERMPEDQRQVKRGPPKTRKVALGDRRVFTKTKQATRLTMCVLLGHPKVECDLE